MNWFEFYKKKLNKRCTALFALGVLLFIISFITTRVTSWILSAGGAMLFFGATIAFEFVNEEVLQ